MKKLRENVAVALARSSSSVQRFVQLGDEL